MTRNRTLSAGIVAAVATLTTFGGLLSQAAQAAPQHSLGDLIAQRQKTKNEWRNLATAAGGLAALGLLKHDNTLTFAGAAGALYSLDRYEKDRKSQDKASRARASIFNQDHFTRDGHRYDRKIVNKGGHRYYQFVRR